MCVCGFKFNLETQFSWISRESLPLCVCVDRAPEQAHARLQILFCPPFCACTICLD